MLSKIGTEISFDKYVTEYNVNDSKSFFDILRIHKDYISHITIYEDADVSLSSYGGSYTFDKLDEKFDLNYPYFDDMYIFFKDDDTCFRYKGFEDKLEVITQNPNFDLETFLSEKSTLDRSIYSIVETTFDYL